jgi:hypothetical protein
MKTLLKSGLYSIGVVIKAFLQVKSTLVDGSPHEFNIRLVSSNNGARPFNIVTIIFSKTKESMNVRNRYALEN